EVSVLEAFLEGAGLCLAAGVNAVGQARGHGLAGEAVDHVVDSVCLIGLDLELEPHLTALSLILGFSSKVDSRRSHRHSCTRLSHLKTRYNTRLSLVFLFQTAYIFLLGSA